MGNSTAQRKMGLIGATAIGIGGMVGGGIFAVLGEAVSLGHGGTPIAFVVAGVVALLTAHSYAKLSAAFPSRGGTIEFVSKAFDRTLISGSINVLLWLSYLATISLYAVAFGSYAAQLVPGGSSDLVRHLLISLAIISPGLINVFSAALVARMESAVVAIKLILLGLVVAVGASHVDAERLDPTTWGNPINLFVAGFVIFVAYEGFELISNTAEDVRSPKVLTRAYYLSVGLVVVLYVVIAIITVGSVSEQKIAESKDYALAVAAEPSLGHVGFVLVAITAVLATFSAINATVFGNARLSYMLATRRELPAVEGHERHGTPLDAVVTISALSLVMANLLPTISIAVVSSASFLLVFTVVNYAAWRRGPEIGAQRWLTAIATATSAVALVALVAQSARTNLLGLAVFLGLVAFSGVFEFSMQRRRASS